MFKKTVLATLMGCALLTQVMPAAAAEGKSHAVSYLTSWGLPDISVVTAELNKSDIDIFMLSFGSWDSEGEVTVSNDMLTAPNFDSYWMPQQYLSWTQLKHDNPEKKMVVAFGGESAESIWTHLNTPAQRETVAKNLAELLEKSFPVYKRGLKPEELAGECLSLASDGSGICDYALYQNAGEVYLDGIDFDFERKSRLTQQENDNLFDLVKRVRALVGDKKLLSLTTYHVGADPENCEDPSVAKDCSYIEDARSAHHGEVTKLLQDSKDLFDFFNVMTYDAGKRFNYKVAMQNYANAVGDKSKILVGATINSQWGPESNFVETKENNIERAKWQAENGFGGFFVWALGFNTEQMSLANQISYVNDMVKVANDARPVTPVEPETPVTPEEPVEPENPGIDLAIPDVSKQPVLSYVDYETGGEIKLFTSSDTFKKGTWKVRINGTDTFEFSKGKVHSAYSSEVSPQVRMLSYTPKVALKEGDTITLHLNGEATTSQTVKVQKGEKYAADQAVKSVSVENGKIIVKYKSAEFNQPNDYRVNLNGKYVMSSFAGKAYYSYVKKSADEITVSSGSKSVKPGDEILIQRVSGVPGSGGYVSTDIYTHIVK